MLKVMENSRQTNLKLILAIALFGWILPSSFTWAQDKFIVDYQISYLQKIQSDWQKELTKIESRLKNPNSFQNSADYAEYQRADTIITGNLKILGSIFETLGKKRSHFVSHKSFPVCDYFYAEGINIEPYNVELEKVSSLFGHLFPDVSFSFQTRPQVMIYKTAKDYSVFEGLPPGVLGHEISARSSAAKALVQFVGAENRKFHFLATYQQTNFDVFHHELSHLFLSKFIDPNNLSITNQRTSSFLNEGFAENIAATFNEKVYQKRLLPLVQNDTGKSTPPIAQWLNSKTSLQSSGKETMNFYSEATLFVRWMSTVPNGFQLVKQLMKSNDNEHESVLKNFQSGQGLEREGFQAYQTWRVKELARLKEVLKGDLVNELQKEINEEEKEFTTGGSESESSS
jgi:hypothetical protein